jgi:hypothetical protein
VLSDAGSLDAEQLRERLSLHPRSARDFFDALVALGMLDRTDGRYSNTAETDLFLDPAKPTYIGGMLEMSSIRLYAFWGSLTEGLRTGQPQSEVKTGGEFFETLYADPEKLAQFTAAMSGLSRTTGEAIAARFPWRDYGSVIDIGCAQGAVPVAIAAAHDHLTGGGFDLPPVEPIFNSYVATFALADRLSFTPGNFFTDPLPRADVLVMGHILHDWELDQKRLLLQKAYDALPTGGALIVHEAIIDDERRHNAFGLLMSLNMLIERGPVSTSPAQTVAAGWPTWASARAMSSTWRAPTRWWLGSSSGTDSVGAALSRDALSWTDTARLTGCPAQVVSETLLAFRAGCPSWHRLGGRSCTEPKAHERVSCAAIFGSTPVIRRILCQRQSLRARPGSRHEPASRRTQARHCSGAAP